MRNHSIPLSPYSTILFFTLTTLLWFRFNNFCDETQENKIMAKNSLEIFTAIDWNHLHYFSSSHLLMSPTHPHLSRFLFAYFIDQSPFISQTHFRKRVFFFLQQVSCLYHSFSKPFKNGIQKRIIFASSSCSFGSFKQPGDSERRKPLQVLHLDCDLRHYLSSWCSPTGTKYTTIVSTYRRFDIPFLLV